MLFLTPNYAIPIPHPPQMGNKGNYVVSLSQFTRWLGNIAEEEFGVEVYPGFAGAGLLMSEHEDSPDPFDPGRTVKSVRVITNEVGLSKIDIRTRNDIPVQSDFTSRRRTWIFVQTTLLTLQPSSRRSTTNIRYRFKGSMES